MNRTVALLNRAVFTRVPSRSKAFMGPYKNTMNDLPQPGGNWQTHYDANQRKYNAHLVGGIAFLLTVITFGKVNGVFWLNFLPPDRPADKNDYSEWVDED